jgi:hypothetical protein
MASITEEYQRALPFALHNVSPQLAALHMTRARLLSENIIALSTTSCVCCGSLILPAQGNIRLRRVRVTDEAPRAPSARPNQSPSSSRSYRKIILRKCAACGNQEFRPVDGNAPRFPSVRHTSKFKSLETTINIASGTQPIQARGATIPDSVASQHSTPRAINPKLPGVSPPATSLANTGATSNASPQAPASAKPPKARSNKKRSGLQEMLARNRTQKQNEGEEVGSRTGLADFLVGL